MRDSREETEAGEDTPWFERQDEAAVRDVCAILSAHWETLRSPLIQILAPEYDRGKGGVSGQEAAELVQGFSKACQSGSLNDLGEPGSRLAEYPKILAARGVGIRAWTNVCLLLQNQLTPRLVSAHAADPPRLAASLRVLQTCASRSSSGLSEAHVATQARLLAFERTQAEQAQMRFMRLAESGIIGILVCDFQGNIVEANDGFLNKFGYSRVELLAGRVRWADMTPAEWKHLDEDAIQQLLGTGKTRCWEKEYFHKDGHRIPILVGVATLNERQTIAFVLDISERKRLEETRKRSLELETENRRIQEASRLKSEFVANMSHELRTPLNAILGFVELIHDGEVAPDSPQYQEFLQDILGSGRHLQQLINDVLDFAKVEAGKIEFRPEAVEIDQLIGEVSGLLRTLAASKRIRIATHVAPEVRHAWLDPGRFRQVLYNYLSNALKFTDPGGAVEVRAVFHPPAGLRLVVEDTGIGIAPADVGRLFVEFQQLEAGAMKTHTGTGLGLALTKRLVEAQGGTVGVESVQGQGSRFHAILPLRPESALAHGQASSRP